MSVEFDTQRHEVEEMRNNERHERIRQEYWGEPSEILQTLGLVIDEQAYTQRAQHIVNCLADCLFNKHTNNDAYKMFFDSIREEIDSGFEEEIDRRYDDGWCDE